MKKILLGIWLVFISGTLYSLNKILEMQPSKRIFYPRAGYLDTPQGPMTGLAMLAVIILVATTFYILSKKTNSTNKEA